MRNHLKPKTKRSSQVIKYFILPAMIILFIIASPLSFLKSFLEKSLKKSLNCKVTLGEIQGNFFQDLTLKNIVIKECNNSMNAEIGQIQFRHKLQFFKGPLRLMETIRISNAKIRLNQKTANLSQIEVAVQIPLILKQLPLGTIKIAGFYEGYPLQIQADIDQRPALTGNTGAPLSAIKKGHNFPKDQQPQSFSLQGQIGSAQIHLVSAGYFDLKNWSNSEISTETFDIHGNATDFLSPLTSQTPVIEGHLSAEMHSQEIQSSGVVSIEHKLKPVSRLEWKATTGPLSSLQAPQNLAIQSLKWTSHCPLLTLQKPTTLTWDPHEPLPIGALDLKGCAGDLHYQKQKNGSLKLSLSKIRLNLLSKALAMTQTVPGPSRLDFTVLLPWGLKKTRGILSAKFEMPFMDLDRPIIFSINSKFNESRADAQFQTTLKTESLTGKLYVLNPFMPKPMGHLEADIHNLNLTSFNSARSKSTLAGSLNAKIVASASANQALVEVQSDGRVEFNAPPINYNTQLRYDGHDFSANGTMNLTQNTKPLSFIATMKAPLQKFLQQGYKAALKFPMQWSLETNNFNITPYLANESAPNNEKVLIFLNAKASGKGSISNPSTKADIKLSTNTGPLAQLGGTIVGRHVNATVTAKNANLDGPLSLMESFFSLHNSNLNATYAITGVMPQLEYNGELQLLADEVRIPSLQIALERPAVSLKGHNKTLDITNLSAGSGHGFIDGKGQLLMQNGFEPLSLLLQGNFKNFSPLSNDKVSLEASGKFSLNANRAQSTFGGEIAIDEGNILLAESSQKKTLESLNDLEDLVVIEQQKKSQNENFISELRGNIHIKAPARFWVKGPDLAIDLKADLHAGINESHEFFLNGTIDSRRGFVEIFGRRLELRHGHVDLTGDYNNPHIQAQAVYNVTPRNIIVALDGPQDTLKPQLYSDPPGYSEDECLGVLFTGNPNFQGGSGGKSSITGIASGFVVGQLKKKLGPKLPFDTITADLRTEDEKREEGDRSTRDKKANLEVGKYISDRAFLKVGRAFATQQSEAVNMITLDYRLSNKWSFETKQTDSGRSDVGLLWTKNYF